MCGQRELNSGPLLSLTPDCAAPMWFDPAQLVAVRMRRMSGIEHVSVVIQDDFIARQTRAQPIAALAELIWNSLDGEASRVDVELEHSDLAGGLIEDRRV